jgi:hypothetical protein
MSKNEIFNLNYSLNSSTQTIDELWKSIAAFAVARVADNSKYNGHYPIDIRELQLPALKSLVEVIELTHQKMISDLDIPDSQKPLSETVRMAPNIHDRISVADDRVMAVSWYDLWNLLTPLFDVAPNHDTRPYVIGVDNIPVRALVRHELLVDSGNRAYIGSMVGYLDVYVNRNIIMANYRDISLQVLNLKDKKSGIVNVMFPKTDNLPELNLEIDLALDTLVLYW